MNPLSKEAVLARSPGGNRKCPDTGKLRAVCDCRKCVGRRSQEKGKRSQARTRKALQKVSGGKPVATFRGQQANEEAWRGVFRMETKSGRQVHAVVVRFLDAESQSLQEKAIGDLRPFCLAVQAQEGMSDQIWMFRSSDLPRILEALR